MEPSSTHTPSTPVELEAGGAELYGDLAVASDARALVVLASGAGDERHRADAAAIVRSLEEDRLGVFSLGLLSREEAGVDATTARYSTDPGFLTARLEDALDWARRRPALGALPMAVLADASAAPAALVVAARHPEWLRALVLRGGALDAAEGWLADVEVPTLLLAAPGSGEADAERDVGKAMSAHVRIEVLDDTPPGAEQPGPAEDVARAARSWLAGHV
jgi:putative phosphoribosyl transferase